jgi:hypothetical protein
MRGAQGRPAEIQSFEIPLLLFARTIRFNTSVIAGCIFCLQSLTLHWIETVLECIAELCIKFRKHKVLLAESVKYYSRLIKLANIVCEALDLYFRNVCIGEIIKQRTNRLSDAPAGACYITEG